MLFKKGLLTVPIHPRTFAILAFFVLTLVGALHGHGLRPFLQTAGSWLPFLRKGSDR